jgi:hypothetical protein
LNNNIITYLDQNLTGKKKLITRTQFVAAIVAFVAHAAAFLLLLPPAFFFEFLCSPIPFAFALLQLFEN